MIISHKYKFIFVHPQRTAGISISRTLFESGIVGIDEYFSNISEPYKLHSSISEVRNEPFFDEYLKFGFVRNPWQRMHSFFNFKRSRAMSDPKKFKSDFEKTSFGYAKWLPNRKDKFSLKRYYTIDGEDVMDVYLRFENLEEDFKSIMDRLGVPNVNLQSLNSAPNMVRNNNEIIKTGHIIEKNFSWEINKFDYKPPKDFK